MTHDQQPTTNALLDELRRMATDDSLDEMTFRRLALAGIAGSYQLVAEQKKIIESWGDHRHSDIERRLGSLEKRDLMTLVAAIAGAIGIAWFGPRQ